MSKYFLFLWHLDKYFLCDYRYIDVKYLVIALYFGVFSSARAADPLCDLIKAMRAQHFLRFPKSGPFLENLEILATKGKVDEVWKLYKRAKDTQRYGNKKLKSAKELLQKALEVNEQGYAKKLNELKELDRDKLLEMFWTQRKENFSPTLSIKDKEFLKLYKNARKKTWIDVLDGMSWRDYTSRFWKEIKEADGAVEN